MTKVHVYSLKIAAQLLQYTLYVLSSGIDKGKGKRYNIFNL